MLHSFQELSGSKVVQPSYVTGNNIAQEAIFHIHASLPSRKRSSCNVFNSVAHILAPRSTNFLFVQLTDNSVMHYTICKAQVCSGVMQSNFSVVMSQFFNYCCVTFHFESLGLPRLSSLASPFPSANILHHFALF